MARKNMSGGDAEYFKISVSLIWAIFRPVGVVCSGLGLQEPCSGRVDGAGRGRNLQSASHSSV